MKVLVLVVALAVACSDAQRDTINFVAVGDWGDSGSNGQARQIRVADIMNQWCDTNECDFIISTGDNFYPDGAEADDDPRLISQWRDLYSGDAIADLIWYISLGNHDHHNNNEVHQLAYASTEDRFYMPNYWYPMEFNEAGTSLLLVAIDSEALRQNKYDPAQQLADLTEYLANSNADWIFVFNHHPPYSCARRWGDQTMHEQVVPIIDEYMVDLFISGHEHNLQHMSPVDESFPRTDYFISGGGGRSSYAYDQNNCDTALGYGFQNLFFDETYGFTSFEVGANEVTVKHYTYTSDDTPEEIYSFTRGSNAAFRK